MFTFSAMLLVIMTTMYAWAYKIDHPRKPTQWEGDTGNQLIAAVICGVTAVLILFVSTMIYIDNRSEVAQLRAFYNNTLSTYSQYIDEQESTITIGTLPEALLQQALLEKIADYNAGLAGFKTYDSMFMIREVVPNIGDLKYIDMKIGG